MAAEFKLRGYVVEGRLGRGASGEVWQARAASSGARVALKRIPATSDEQRARARAEAALLCALDHPNLVRLHAVVPTADALVLVLDLADGGSLADLLAARGRLTPGEVITAVAPVAAALAYLHGQGVVHGDVSAGNVLFTGEGVPLLGDVGVARLTGDDRGAAATPAYVDPAVAAGSIPGPPSDVFMLGGVALHALTGTPPWSAPDAAAALDLAARGELGDVGERLTGAGVSPAMAAVLGRALQVDPYRRGAAADLALDLRHSGRPVAVELAAGRGGRPATGWSGPRHAVRPAAEPIRQGRPDPAPADGPRPAFARPAELGAPAEPPTRMVGPRPRPEIPRPPRRSARARWRFAGLSAAAVALAAAGGVVWAEAQGPPKANGTTRPPMEVRTPDGPTTAPATTVPATTAAATTVPANGAGAASPQDSPVPPPAGSTVAVSPAQRWRAVLDTLDAVRARAFATRDPALLPRVYSAAPLIAADTALLRELVPAGCGLRGVRTRYTDVVVRPAGDSATVLVTAVLPPSQLACQGRTRASVPGAGPTRLRLRLVRTADGPRIAAQSLLGG